MSLSMAGEIRKFSEAKLKLKRQLTKRMEFEKMKLDIIEKERKKEKKVN